MTCYIPCFTQFVTPIVHRIKERYSSSHVVTYLDLDPVKFKEFKSQPSDACGVHQSGFDRIIQYQQGEIEIEELLEEYMEEGND